MKKIAYVLAALATIAVAAPAVAQDKPMMDKKSDMGMHHSMHHKMMMHHKMRMMHHKNMMKKDNM